MYFKKNKKAILYLPGSVGDNFMMLALAQQLKDAQFGEIAITSNVSAPIYKKLCQTLELSDDVFNIRDIFSVLKLYLCSFIQDTYFVFILTPDSRLVSYMSFIFNFLSPTKISYCLYTDIHVKPIVFGRKIICTEQNTIQELFSKTFKNLSIHTDAKYPYLSLSKLNKNNYCILHIYPSHSDRMVNKEIIKKELIRYYLAHPDTPNLIICTGTMSDRSMNDNFDDYVPDHCDILDFRGLDSLFSFMYMIHDCDRYFGVHTGPTHIAAMFQKKGLVFYKQNRPVVSVEYNKNFEVLLYD